MYDLERFGRRADVCAGVIFYPCDIYYSPASTINRARTVNYLSVCSGIEAASVAWHELGWNPVAFSEIEKFPCAVLAHRFPTVPNLGDMTKFNEWPEMDVDIVVGGTPCQAFSVAGLRQGLNDPRGNLTLTFLGIVKKYQPNFVVWENVPGVLSDKTKALYSFLDGLEEIGYCVIGFDILDAQFFGLAQRRRRVFVCAQKIDYLLSQKTGHSVLIFIQCLAEILRLLLVAQSGQLNPGAENSDLENNPSILSLKKRMKLFGLQKEGQALLWLRKLEEILPWFDSAPEDLELNRGSNSAEGLKIFVDIKCAASTTEKMELISESQNIGPLWLKRLAACLVSANEFITLTLKKETTEEEIFFYAKTLLTTAEFTLNLTASLPNSFQAATSLSTAIQEYINYARSASSRIPSELEWICRWSDFELQAEFTLLAISDFREESDPAEILPITESLRGDNPPSRETRKEITGTLSARTQGGGGLGTDFDLAGGCIPIQEPGKRTGRSTSDRGCGVGIADEGEPMYTLQAGAVHGVAHALTGFAKYTDSNPTLRANGGDQGGGSEALISVVAHTLKAVGFDASEDGTGRGTPLIACKGSFWNGEEVTQTLDAVLSKGQMMPEKNRFPCVLVPPVAFSCKDSGTDAGEISPTLRSMGHSGSHPNAGGQVAIAFQESQSGCREYDTAGCLRANGPGHDPVGTRVRTQMSVRRLTPRECERLQGFPTSNFRVMFSVCLDHQKSSALVEMKCHRSQNNASDAEEKRRSEDAQYAEYHLQNDPDTSAAAVAVHVRLSHEPKLLVIRNQGKWVWSADGAEKQNPYPLHIKTESFAPAFAQLMQDAEALVLTGKGGSRESMTFSITPENGKVFAALFGQENEESARDAELNLSEAIKCITSGLGQKTNTSPQFIQTWLCSALNVIALFIPKETKTGNSFSLIVDFESDYTQIPFRKKPSTNCPDGPRYKALGNSMAVPCMRWIGKRIAMADAVSLNDDWT